MPVEQNGFHDHVHHKERNECSMHKNNHYKDLLTELAAIDIRSVERYLGYKEARDYFVDRGKLQDIEWNFVRSSHKILDKLPQRLKSTNGISIVVPDNKTNLNTSQRKKITIFSQETIIISEGIEVPDFDYATGVEFWEGPDISNCLDLAYRYTPEVKRGIILPLPENVNILNPDDFNEAFESELIKGVSPQDEKILDAILDGRINGDSIELKRMVQKDETDYHDAFFAASLVATTSSCLPSNVFLLNTDGQALGINENLLKIGLLLPSLERMPLATAIRLREDYNEAFLRFQFALTSLCEKWKTAEDDRRFVCILQELEHNIYELHNSFAEIKKVHRSMAIATGLVTFVFFYPVKDPSLRNHLYSLFSGIATSTFIECFKNVRAVPNIESHPLYFPLLLSGCVSETPFKKKQQRGARFDK